MSDALVWPDWNDRGRPLSLTCLVSQALGTVRSDPLNYPVLMHFPQLQRDARFLVQACLEGDEAQVIIDRADAYLKTLLHVRRAAASAPRDKDARDRAKDRFPQADKARAAMQAQVQLQIQLASPQPTLF